MAKVEPKLTIAGLGIDVSWKVFALAAFGMIIASILSITLLAMVAGVKVNVRNWHWLRGIRPHQVETVEDEERPRIFRTEESEEPN